MHVAFERPLPVGIVRERLADVSDTLVSSEAEVEQDHGDQEQGVVDELGRSHDLPNLYLVDTGIFPRCTSVNPMLTAMALAHRTSGVVADAL